MARTSPRALGALVGLLIAVPVAAAQDAKPAPTSCAGLSFEDPAGDASATPRPAGAPGLRGGDNMDITGGFLRYVPGATGTNVLTANIRVADLTKEVEPWADATVWYFRFSLGDVAHYLSAQVDVDGAAAFAYGTASGNQLTPAGETTGRLFEGKDGIVQIDVPVAAMKLEGKKLTAVHARASWAAVLPTGNSLSVTEDSGPDSSAGKDFDVVPCAQDGVPTQPGPAPEPERRATPAPAAETPAAAPPAAPPRLDVKVIAGDVSARRANRRRRFRVKLTSPTLVYAVSAQLLRNGKRVARGWLDEIKGRRSLRLRVMRPLKAGTYELALRASEPTGETRTGSVLIRVKR